LRTLYTTLSPAYSVTVEILQSRVQVTLQEVLDTLTECQLNRAMTTKSDAVSEALYTQHEERGGCGGRREGYRGGEGRDQKPWCTWCKTGTHTTDNYWTKDKKNNKRTREDQGLMTVGCYYCGEKGHIRIDCPTKQKENALRNSLKNTEHAAGNGPTALKPEDYPQ
jgi:hypothetical protein